MDVMGLTSIVPCRDCKLCHADRDQDLRNSLFLRLFMPVCRAAMSSSRSVEAGARLLGLSGESIFEGKVSNLI